METGSYLMQAFRDCPWFLTLAKLKEIESVLNKKFLGGVNYEELKAEYMAHKNNAAMYSRNIDPKTGYELVGSKAIVPVHGTLLRRAGWLDAMSGAASLGRVEMSIKEALNSPMVDHLILDVDSPGGHDPSAIAELLYSARNEKRISALCTGSMCSASLWIGLAADEVYSNSQLNSVGSIGVYMVRQENLDNDPGTKNHYIVAGNYKLVGNPDLPMTDSEQQYLQNMMDESYRVFVESVAKYRGAEVDYVLESWADGRVFQAKDAVQLGMIDGIASLDDLLND